MKTIGQIIHQKNFILVITDSNGNPLYREYADRLWAKRKFDSKGNVTHYKSSRVIDDTRP